MTILFLAILAVAWVAVVMPAVNQARQVAPLKSAEAFRRGMSSIAPPEIASIDAQAVMNDRRAAVKVRVRRRRVLFVVLVGLAALTALGAVLAGGSWWTYQLAGDGALALYCALLVGRRRRTLERRRKVRHLRPRVRPAVAVHEPARAGARRG